MDVWIGAGWILFLGFWLLFGRALLFQLSLMAAWEPQDFGIPVALPAAMAEGRLVLEFAQRRVPIDGTIPDWSENRAGNQVLLLRPAPSATWQAVTDAAEIAAQWARRGENRLVALESSSSLQ